VTPLVKEEVNKFLQESRSLKAAPQRKSKLLLNKLGLFPIEGDNLRNKS